MKEVEYDLLESIVIFMEKEGTNYKTVTFNIDNDQVEEIYDFIGKEYTIEQLEGAVDICLAHEWIEHRSMSGKYNNLGLTEKGIGVVRSKRKQKEILNNRTLLKKTSDYIEDHKGLFVFLSFTIALTSLLITVYKGD